MVAQVISDHFTELERTIDQLDGTVTLHKWALIGLAAFAAMCAVAAAYNAGDIHRLSSRVLVLEANIVAPLDEDDAEPVTEPIPVVQPAPVQRPKPTPGPRTTPSAAVIEAGAHQLADTAPVPTAGRHRKH